MSIQYLIILRYCDNAQKHTPQLVQGVQKGEIMIISKDAEKILRFVNKRENLKKSLIAFAAFFITTVISVIAIIATRSA